MLCRYWAAKALLIFLSPYLHYIILNYSLLRYKKCSSAQAKHVKHTKKHII